MGARAGAGISFEDSGVDAFAEAASRAALALGGPADLALVFAGPANLEYAEDGVAAVRERLRPAALSGCGAQGVVGSGRELENGGVCVWAASFDGGEVEPFHAETIETEDSLTVAGVPELAGADAAILLADGYTFPAEPLLGALAEEHPGVPVVGGLASGGPGPAALLDADGPVASGAVGAVLRGVEVRPCVSQGALPVGPEMTVTAAEGNSIHELASRPAVERLKEAITELDSHERALASGGLLLGIVVDQNKPDYERGDFLVRGLAGVEEETGSVVVAATPRVGQTVRLHVRDAASAHEDLIHALDKQLESLGGPPAGALLFTCNGRGAGMFGIPDHDAGAVAEAFGNAPTAGFFCAGEIGPVGGRSFVHGFTATIAAFPA